MKITLTKDGVKRKIEISANARITAYETARKYDCTCCLYYLGKHKNEYVCEQKICPAEAYGYDATNECQDIYKLIFKEVYA